MGRPSGRVRSDAGQVMPLMVVAIVVITGLAMVATEIGAVLGEAARARTAADAAALAGAARGRAAATEMAAANGAELVDFSRTGNQVAVTVRVGRADREARAQVVVTWVEPGDPPDDPVVRGLSGQSTGDLGALGSLGLHSSRLDQRW